MSKLTELEWAALRIAAQIRLIDYVSEQLPANPTVLELGLGNGRTYDHLRNRLPAAEIYVFDREMKAKLTSQPPIDRFIKGELAETLPAFATRSPRSADLVHADLGNGNPDDDARLAQFLAREVRALTSETAWVLTSTQLDVDWLSQVNVAGVDPLSRYQLYAMSN